ncbi:MAG: signal recognition particle-docking protein FtsY [Bacteroidetes bacterium]|nr:signal recognition particle-docking protein FtsY [Bacteroidota bacterium]MDA0938543.1 signal recognition particle-docking protein FtsY [Bacteroidota bacterium]MDA1345511.1 signal recognition particle-docking protein FtsY [Bacteroidota bacterium]
MNRLRSLFTSTQKKQLEAGLSQTKKSFFSKLGTALIGKSKVDDDLLDELEEVLIRSDVGVATTIKIIEALEARVAKDKFLGTDALGQIMQEEITKILKHSNPSVPQAFDAPLPNSPQIVMVVGVNGVGKTTTIGKLAHHYKQAGKKVLLGAADTFRAGAIDQLQIWADRVGVSLVKQEMGSDPASVAFDTLQSAVAQQADIVFIDTAGRLHNKINLMNELSKVKRVMDKIVPGAPHEILLVLDGSTGQNAFEQAKQFTAATDVNALTITKLDGTAKGGVVMGISDQFQIPVKYIGVGEGMDDLQLFDSMTFIETLFDDTF